MKIYSEGKIDHIQNLSTVTENKLKQTEVNTETEIAQIFNSVKQKTVEIQEINNAWSQFKNQINSINENVNKNTINTNTMLNYLQN